jgi:hypothetical protein
MDAQSNIGTAMLACSGGAPLQGQLPVISREQLAIIMFGTVFLFIGLAACAFAAVRRLLYFYRLLRDQCELS